MSVADRTLEALQALQRARQALDTLWLECRQSVPSVSQLDALVHNIVAELVGAHDALEHVIEAELRANIGLIHRNHDHDPQRMNLDSEDDENA